MSLVSMSVAAGSEPPGLITGRDLLLFARACFMPDLLAPAWAPHPACACAAHPACDLLLPRAFLLPRAAPPACAAPSPP
eukprot:767519-Hanusia_phi.AAC.3